MRVVIVAESFLPQINGVAHSVRHVAVNLRRGGHAVLIIAPGPGPITYDGIPVIRARSIPFPIYPELPLGLPDVAVRHTIESFRPDVVHLASPVVLGMSGLRAAQRIGVPTVAVYQTDLVGFAQQYGIVGVERTLWAWTRRLYGRADRTLVPSRAAAAQLAAIDVPTIALWGRGVDLEQFHPRRRDPELRRMLAPNGEALAGYVGRVATEKRVHLLRHVADLPGTRLVVIGDGPALEELRELAPGAAFLGLLHDTELARAVASLDVFVHTGAHETFCQAVQEALASGVPVVAPAAGGPLDLVQDGHTGVFYPPDDVTALRRSVERLAADSDEREWMGWAARRSVLGRDWHRLVDDLVETHYHAVVTGRRGKVAA